MTGMPKALAPRAAYLAAHLLPGLPSGVVPVLEYPRGTSMTSDLRSMPNSKVRANCNDYYHHRPCKAGKLTLWELNELEHRKMDPVDAAPRSGDEAVGELDGLAEVVRRKARPAAERPKATSALSKATHSSFLGGGHQRG